MAKKKNLDFSQVALAVVEKATGAAPIAGKRQLTLASSPQRKRHPKHKHKN
jgi:hypothetical protein